MIILLLLFLLTGCFSTNSGVITQPEKTAEPLLTFNGKALIELGRFSRLDEMSNPKVSIVWNEMDQSSISRYSIPLNSTTHQVFPFPFSTTLSENPPLSLNNPLNIILGNIYLYDDVNGNGALDDEIHPELIHFRDSLKQSKQTLLLALQALTEVSDIQHYSMQTDSYFWDTPHDISFMHSDSSIDSSWSSLIDYHHLTPLNLASERRWVLRFSNKWEQFLYKRANITLVESDTTFSSNGRITIQDTYNRRLYPKTGYESPFEERLKQATIASAHYQRLTKTIHNLRLENRWNEHIYTPNDTHDWIAGMSLNSFVFFLFDQNEHDQLTQLNALSSLLGNPLISNIESLTLGYNILSCNENYLCSVLTETDSVNIHLGDSPCYLEGCQRPIDTPLTQSELSLDSSFLSIYTGMYTSPLSSDSLTLIAHNDALWIITPLKESIKLSSTDSINFSNTLFSINCTFDKTTDPLSIVYTTAEASHTITKQRETIDHDTRLLDSINTYTPTSLTESELQDYTGRYTLDSAHALIIAVQDSQLVVSITGQGFFSIQPISTDLFRHTESSAHIRFDRSTSGDITKVTFESVSRYFTAPSETYTPKSAAEFSYDLSYSAVPLHSMSHGSSMNTSKKYNCLTDLLSLDTADFYSTTQQSTAEPLLWGKTKSSFTLKVDSVDKFYVSLHGCPNNLTDSTQVRMRITTGTSPETIETFVEDEMTVTFYKNGSYKNINPILSHGVSPFYVKVSFFPLYGNNAPIIFDSYSIYSEDHIDY
ncbi:MAG: DUF3471 domain-containing protein [Fibrobacterales bacterium]